MIIIDRISDHVIFIISLSCDRIMDVYISNLTVKREKIVKIEKKSRKNSKINKATSRFLYKSIFAAVTRLNASRPFPSRVVLLLVEEPSTSKSQLLVRICQYSVYIDDPHTHTHTCTHTREPQR